MEFFNCAHLMSLRKAKAIEGQIILLDVNREISRHGEEWVIKELKHLSAMGVPFAIKNLSSIKHLSMYSILNTHPIFVRMVGECFNRMVDGSGVTSFGEQTIALIEDFGSMVDVGGLPARALISALRVIHKKFVVSGAVLSTFVDEKAFSFEIENLLSTKDCLILIDTDFSSCKEVGESIFNFIKIYGSKNLAVGQNKHKKSKLNKLRAELELLGISNEDIEKLFYKNAKNFFGTSYEISKFKQVAI